MNAIGKIGAINHQVSIPNRDSTSIAFGIDCFDWINQVNHQRVEAKGCTIRD